MEATEFFLPNGLRILYRPLPYSKVFHCGWVVNAGSRDDTTGCEGIAHFIEHMVFKGTTTRKMMNILQEIESVGGEMNAFTTKDKTCIYASAMADYFENAVSVLTDMTFNSLFPPSEIEKEKAVIQEEIDMYQDIPEETILEDFEALLFGGHPVGNPILGTHESVGNISKQAIQSFLNDHYLTNNMAFFAIGKIEENTFHAAVNKYISPLTPLQKPRQRIPPTIMPAFHQVKELPNQQTHVVLGGAAPALLKEGYYPFILLNNHLGGPSMNSVFNLNIREKHALVYGIYSFHNAYTDSGMWGIYFSCDVKNKDKILRLIQKDLQKFAEKPPSQKLLEQMKKQFIGQQTLAQENPQSQMIGTAKDLLDFEKIISLEEHASQIASVTPAMIHQIAQTYFFYPLLSSLIYLPEPE